MTRRLLLPAFLLLFAVQTLPAATLAWQNQRRLGSGRSILLTVDTRDPRDLLRGEYSVLAYEIGRLQNAPMPAPPVDGSCDLERRTTCPVAAGRSVYVMLAPDGDGTARLVDARFDHPTQGSSFIHGTIRQATITARGTRVGSAAACEAEACLTGQVGYGIETWYGPQGRPARLDAQRRGEVRVEARVTDEGWPCSTRSA